jgi:hypothetical protein
VDTSLGNDVLHLHHLWRNSHTTCAYCQSRRLSEYTPLVAESQYIQFFGLQSIRCFDYIAIIPISLQFALCYVVCFAFQTWLIFWIGYLFEDPKMTWTACIILFYMFYFFPILFEVATMVRKRIWPTPHADGSSPALLRMDSSKQRTFSLGCPVFISFLLFKPYVRDQDVFRPALTLWVWIYISFAFCWLLFGIAKDSPGSILGSIYRRGFRVDSFKGSQAALVAFLTFLASIMHYGAMYKPSGTVNSEWTGIFG